ncbi:TetR family transcriptional regulator [Streptomyces fuscichromogenes]|uniref:TetR family transcriptional regulator n=1 Tax=Streptomyces fuscichromogenes TaxID=1324013 RepID=UPI0037F71E7C
MSEKKSVLRDAKRRAVQDEVAAIAIRLFAEQGYDTTTVDQITQAAGLSQRSFFRYFAGKDDVMGHAFAATGADIAAALADRPARERPWLALRRAFDKLINQLSGDDRGLEVMRMIYETPSLHAAQLRKEALWRVGIAESVAPRLPSGLTADERRVQAGALAAAAVASFEWARGEWVACDGTTPLDQLVDSAMDVVSRLDPRPESASASNGRG